MYRRAHIAVRHHKWLFRQASVRSDVDGIGTGFCFLILTNAKLGCLLAGSELGPID